jgi:hypothetical protein
VKNINKSMKSKNDERYTPSILVYPIIKYLKPNSIVWCPFDTKDSEFTILLTEAGHKVLYNPPFTLKLKVLERLYSLNKPFAMLLNLECLNYQEVGNFFLDKNLQLIIVDKKVSFDGNTASFNTSYFCSKMLPKDLIFEHLEHNNTRNNFVKSRMKNLEQAVNY